MKRTPRCYPTSPCILFKGHLLIEVFLAHLLHPRYSLPEFLVCFFYSLFTVCSYLFIFSVLTTGLKVSGSKDNVYLIHYYVSRMQPSACIEQTFRKYLIIYQSKPHIGQHYPTWAYHKKCGNLYFFFSLCHCQGIEISSRIK